MSSDLRARRLVSGRALGYVSLCASLLLALCAGCKSADAHAGGATPGASAPAPAASAASKNTAVGTLIGSVRLAPGATLPSYAAEAMERKVLLDTPGPKLPDSCTPPKQDDRTPVRLTPDGKLIGVMLAASGFKHSAPRAPKTIEVAIKDCRLSPRTLVAMQGDTLRIKNEIDFPFMPSFGPTTYNETLSPGQVKDVPLTQPGVQSVLCGFTAPCGRADVVVMQHPVFAVTGEDGSFRIDNFPADESIKINAWHPLFKAQEQTVTVKQGETKQLELTLTPGR